MPPSQKDQIEKLSAENCELRQLVQKLTDRVDNLETSLAELRVHQSEATVRIEAVEENLCEVKSIQQEQQDDQASMLLRLEGAQMYSRKQTLLITGPAVGGATRGEDVRSYAIQLLSEYLGINNLQPQHISACHRLKNPKVILIRFTSLDDTDRVYRARTKPKKRGIIVFESLTAERLAMVNNLKVLKQEQGSNILSYYTQTGKVLVRTSENKETRPLEVPVGSTKDQIRDICRGKKVVLSSTDILNQFREIHGGNQSSDRTDPNSNAGAWQTFTSRRTKARGADGSASNGNPSQTESRSSDT